MQIGPLQLVAIGYDSDDAFRGRVKEELAALRGKGLIRLIDAAFVHRDDAGKLTVLQDSDFDDAELVEYGRALRRLFGLGEAPSPAPTVAAGSDGAGGLKAADLQAILDQIKPGTAGAVALFEHAWAAGLSTAIVEAGGRTLAQGMLTRDLVFAMGEEVAAIAQAERVIEASEAVKMAVFVDTVAFAAAADEAQAAIAAEALASVPDEIRTRIAGQTLRALSAAGVVDDSELETAVTALLDAELLAPDVVERAIEAALAEESAVEDVATAQASQG